MRLPRRTGGVFFVLLRSRHNLSRLPVQKFGRSNASTVTTLKNLVSVSRTIGIGKERQQGDVSYIA
jgi:hypothetical protein